MLCGEATELNNLLPRKIANVCSLVIAGIGSSFSGCFTRD
jgi:hypothetical protein